MNNFQEAEQVSRQSLLRCPTIETNILLALSLLYQEKTQQAHLEFGELLSNWPNWRSSDSEHSMNRLLGSNSLFEKWNDGLQKLKLNS